MRNATSRLPEEFYTDDTVHVARRLLGCRLLTVIDSVVAGGIIVETEAYLGEQDLGCHSARGRTPRTETMFGPPGHAYVYLIYGMYNCLNAVTRQIDEPEAVLIRALRPETGIDTMRQLRTSSRTGRVPKDIDLANGPGKLCQALNIDRSFDGLNLTTSRLWVERGIAVPEEQICSGPRIGIDYAGEWAQKPLRFWIKDEPNVSR